MKNILNSDDATKAPEDYHTVTSQSDIMATPNTDIQACTPGDNFNYDTQPQPGKTDYNREGTGNKNIAQLNYNNQNQQPIYNINPIQFKTFAGEPGENLNNWIRQFNYLLNCRQNYDINNLHHFAASLLIDDADKYYDELHKIPEDWNEF
ncbi:hypothetical protein COBT_002325 [Conglomerata obtusa]